MRGGVLAAASGATAVLTLFLIAPRAAALQPVSHFHDLVAGDGEPGYRDGEFQQARFRFPAGVAVLPKRGLVVVADRGNNRIRAIRLGEANRVETLAGSGKQTSADGRLLEAGFDAPSSIVAISEDALLVNDEGSALFRIVDLARNRVETVAGNRARGVANGPAAGVPLGDVWALLFVPAEQSVYFTQPEHHALRRFDLRSREISTVFANDRRLSRPGALALFQDHICVAERNGTVVRIGTSTGRGPVPDLATVGQADRALALAASDDVLLAVQANAEVPWLSLTTGEKGIPPRAFADAKPVPWLAFDENAPVGVAADPRADRAFFLTAPGMHAVVSFKEYRFSALSDSTSESGTGLVDFAYPTRKPVGTFRILVLGDSRVNNFESAPDRAASPPPGRMEAMPKRLEIFLNSLSALDDADTRVEVLSLTRVSWEPLLIWTSYLAPEAVRRFDVDLVLLMQPPDTKTLEAFLDRRITEKGVPAKAVDLEYLLEPHAVKMRGNPAAAVVARARQHGWVHPHGQGQVYLDPLRTLITDEGARRELLRLFARPLGALRRGVEGARPGTKVVVCYFPFSGRGSGVAERTFWKDLAGAAGTYWLDLLEPFVVLRDTWYPYSAADGHFSPQGHAFFAFVVGHELLESGLVPFRRPQRASRPAIVPSPPLTEAPSSSADVPAPAPEAPIAFPGGSATAIGVAAGVILGFFAARRIERG